MSDVLTKPRTRVMWSAEERAEWLKLFEASGQTAADFCRDNDLPQATLSYWVRQSQEPPSSEATVVEIPRELLAAVPMERAAMPVSVALPSGVRLEVPVGTDTGWLSQLLRSLAGAKE